jgi:hypothetical protein
MSDPVAAELLEGVGTDDGDAEDLRPGQGWIVVRERRHLEATKRADGLENGFHMSARPEADDRDGVICRGLGHGTIIWII